MDRSFLSQSAVIEASRKFVCVRLATYESAAEAEVLKKIFLGRSGQLENTVFALLSPDGNRLLAPSGRSPDFAFVDAHDMAEGMQDIARRYPGRAAPAALPLITDLRLALNIAACDQLPLVVLAGDPSKRLEQQLLPWSQTRGAGRALFVRASLVDCRRQLGAKVDRGLLVVQASTYGDGGKVLGRLEGEAVERFLEGAISRFVVTPKSPREHIGEGRRRGVYWRTAIPVTDPGPR